MNVKVSVIVPVYNASKYIKKMAECLLNQTLRKIEFIFVDDCSTDESIDILYELEREDSARIMVIKLDENVGPGGARNIGMRYASGEYIAFADSDDMLKYSMYEDLYKKAKKNDYDIVECGYYNERKNKELMLWDSNMEGTVTFDKRVKMFLSCGFIWTKIFKRNIIINNNIKFITKIPLEDVDFLCSIYSKVKTVGIVNKPFYYYIDNKNSFSRTRNGMGFLEVTNMFCENYIKHMKNEKIYLEMKEVIEYVVIDAWFDLFKALILDSKMINEDYLKIIDNNLKKYILNYDENVFLVEKAKNDYVAKAFLTNSKNSKEAIEILTKVNCSKQ